MRGVRHRLAIRMRKPDCASHAEAKIGLKANRDPVSSRCRPRSPARPDGDPRTAQKALTKSLIVRASCKADGGGCRHRNDFIFRLPDSQNARPLTGDADEELPARPRHSSFRGWGGGCFCPDQQGGKLRGLCAQCDGLHTDFNRRNARRGAGCHRGRHLRQCRRRRGHRRCGWHGAAGATRKISRISIIMTAAWPAKAAPGFDPSSASAGR